jgi:hypothetical protein
MSDDETTAKTLFDRSYPDAGKAMTKVMPEPSLGEIRYTKRYRNIVLRDDANVELAFVRALRESYRCGCRSGSGRWLPYWFVWIDGRWHNTSEEVVRDWAHGMLRSFNGPDYRITEKAVDELVRHAREALIEEFKDEDPAKAEVRA